MRAGRFQVEPAPEYAGKVYRAEATEGLWATIKGWELGPTLDGEDTERTGYLVAVCIGDDHGLLVEPEELVEVDREPVEL